MSRHLSPRVGRRIDEAQWAALTTPLVAWSANHQSLKKITSVNAATVPKLLRQLCLQPLPATWPIRPLLTSPRPNGKISADAVV